MLRALGNAWHWSTLIRSIPGRVHLSPTGPDAWTFQDERAVPLGSRWTPRVFGNAWRRSIPNHLGQTIPESQSSSRKNCRGAGSAALKIDGKLNGNLAAIPFTWLRPSGRHTIRNACGAVAGGKSRARGSLGADQHFYGLIYILTNNIMRRDSDETE
jgi:hypothetical protein